MKFMQQLVNHAKFNKSMQAQLNPVRNDPASQPAVQAIEQALGSVNFKGIRHFSETERRAIVAVTREFTQDGLLSPTEGDKIVALIQDFRQGGCQAKDGSWPFRHLDPTRMPGDPALTGVIGQLCECYDNNPNLNTFKSTANALLNMVPEQGWAETLRKAFNHVDLGSLSRAERTELIAGLTASVANGRIDQAEGMMLLKTLGKATESPNPAPVIPYQPVPIDPCNPYPPGIPYPFMPGGLDTLHPPVSPCPPWSVSRHSAGQATIDLGRYSMQLNEFPNLITLIDKSTGERLQLAVGQFQVDGHYQPDNCFSGRFTLNLQDGTKITMQSSQDPHNWQHSQIDSMVITRGDRAMTVTGLDSHRLNDVQINQNDFGRAWDYYTRDGLELYENTRGRGWLVADGFQLRQVGQEDWLNQSQTVRKSSPDLLAQLRDLNGMVASRDLDQLISNQFLYR
jgi:hypothetical protein